MPSYLIRGIALGLAASGLGSGVATRVEAQSRLTGSVVAAGSRAPIAGARVAVPALGLGATTDSTGRFALDGISGGEVFVLAQAVGFRPDTALLEFGIREARVMDIVLSPAATVLDEVKVRGRQPEFTGKLAGFEERRQLGIGRFIDSTVLNAQHGRPTADVVGSEVAGVHVVRESSAAYLSTHRMSTRTAFQRPSRERCWLDVWIDGAQVYQEGMPRFDINSLSPETIVGIEIYVGSAQIPARFNKTGAVCGVVVVWTR